MSQILDSIEGLITPEIINKASSFLGEDKSNVSTAVSNIIPEMLSSLMKKGNSPEVESILESAGKNIDVKSQISEIFSGSASSQTQAIGSNFLTSLFGNDLGGLTSQISEDSGISGNSAGKLLAMISPIVAGFLGGSGKGLSGILSSLSSDKGGFSFGDILGKSELAAKIKDLFK